MCALGRIDGESTNVRSITCTNSACPARVSGAGRAGAAARAKQGIKETKAPRNERAGMAPPFEYRVLLIAICT
jgi:hypothetical protein